ncbi:pimeloyl-ACP methyl ester carboxylesterase [Halopolyspora algeriensis]|uniref:Pimeloyl-ACP methyl ester carboxylesterase n=1 Tax=Halopolyspora algeriensis TaxID=1500506 RepID=A0A368VMZ6_9ACTN|nr:alpha/beta hydrolase [Halopolyspora algeriensis]RCW41073.1 pimeloyl-ACP methyl ester carboxylesterase [Halopolyspora algeriensis]TQM53843.1 pimeloyl-ACP methyl ester carboxylesterase [Halopolyspora algeriensis]
MTEDTARQQGWSSEQSTELLVRARGVDLGVETFGEPADPPVLLVGTSMLTFHDDFCRLLAAGSRFVLRYDLRDTGRSTMVDPDAPQYTLRDLVADAAGLLEALEVPRAHVVGFGVGGWIAQLLALDYRDRVASLALMATRPTAPGPADADLPEHAPELMAYLSSAAEPDWSDRDAVVAAMVDWGRCCAGSGPFEEVSVRERAGRIFDRAVAAAPPGADPRAVQRANQLASTFAALDCGPRWREHLGAITAPTLVLHGEQDPFFPIGNGEALAREIPGAELLRLAGTGQELPRRVWDTVVPALLRHTAAG